MKTDAYTKVVLTVIAVSLVTLVIQNLGIVQEARANSEEPGKQYVNLPVNEDGTIDVRVKKDLSDEIMDVNIVRVAGNSSREGLPIKPAEHSLNVNVEEVGGYQVYGAIPTKRE